MMPSYIKYMQKDKDDEWYTPVYGVLPIIKFIPKNKIIWCPFDTKDSNYVKELIKSGYSVKYSHKNEGKNFFNYQPKKWDILVSNPPFSIKDKVLERAYALGKPFALLLPLSALEGVFRTKLYMNYGLELLKFNRRISFNNTRGVSFPTGYFCWKLLPKQLIHEEIDLSD